MIVLQMKTPLALISAILIAVPAHSAHVSPGPGWEHIGKIRNKNQWVWRRILPRPSGSLPMGEYKLLLRYPDSGSSEVHKTIVNCET